MGISDGLQGSGGVDCSVGSIVWVRRRNGSWWPGRILGPNELSASHLMSPRSGTPVKLLGREDASVDWYNLEKSKRVKAFRCGEFDDCIERAESSQGIPIKKREKYARREDAILHALELERQQQKLGVGSNSKKCKKPGKMNTSQMGNDHSTFGNFKSQDENVGNPLHVQKLKQGKQMIWEDDNSEAIPRMRGLQDFGLRIASSKRKLSAVTAPEGSRRFSVVDDHIDILPNGGRNAGNASHVSSSKTSLAAKSKRSQGGLPEESIVKRRDRRRPLVQVLQSSAKLPVSLSFQSNNDALSTLVHGEKEQTRVTCRAKRSKCIYMPADSNDVMDHTERPPGQMQISQTQFRIDNCHPCPGSLAEGSTSDELMEDVESDYSERDYLPVIDEETPIFSGATTQMQPIEPSSGRYTSTDGYRVQGQSESMSSEELDETAGVAADVGVSKWQQKGKRNIRNLTKKPMEVIDGKFSNGSIHETDLEGRGNNLNRRASGPGFYPGGEDLNNVYDEGDLIEKDLMQAQISEFGNRRYPLAKSASKDWNRIITDAVDSEEDPVWGMDGSSQSTLRGYWENRDEFFDPIYGVHRYGMESTLVDVELKVQANYQGEHVPLVSLMSRLNGKAIVGHPIQIEALEDGATDKLLSTHGGFDVEHGDNDGSTGLPPVWRTARRSVMHRVPRPQLSALEGDETADLHPYADLESKPLYRKPYPGNSSHKARLMKKSLSQFRRPPITEKKFPKKLLKKVSISSQKTRTLSSIAIDQKLNCKTGNPGLANKSSVEGLIKPVETGLTTVTCIPVKLVFSRLLEAVGRPPSRPANHGVLKGDTERKPS